MSLWDGMQHEFQVYHGPEGWTSAPVSLACFDVTGCIGCIKHFVSKLPNFRDVKSIGSQKNVPMLRGVASSKKARGHGGRGKLGTSKRLKRQVISFRCKWRSAKWPWLVFLPVCQNYGSRIGPEPFGDSFRASEDSHISSCCTVTPVTAIIPIVSLPPAFSFSSFQHWGAKYLNGAKKHPVATVWPLGDLFCLVTLFRQ